MTEVAAPEVQSQRTRQCRICHEYRPVSMFNKRSAYCHLCSAETPYRKPSYPISVDKKACYKCTVVKNAVEFYPKKENVDGLDIYCIACSNGISQENKYKKRYGDDIVNVNKTCTHCSESKPVHLFGINNRSGDGFHNICATCRKTRGTKYQRTNGETVSEKFCPVCQQVKPASSFCKWKQSRSGLYSNCKECSARRARESGKTLAGFFRKKLGGIRGRCKSRGLDYNLDLLFVLEMYDRQGGKCFYSGIQFVFDFAKKEHRYMTARDWSSGKYSPSIDRIDDSRGYTRDNVVLACYVINIMRNTQTQDEFINHCQLISSVHPGGLSR